MPIWAKCLSYICGQQVPYLLFTATSRPSLPGPWLELHWALAQSSGAPVHGRDNAVPAEVAMYSLVLSSSSPTKSLSPKPGVFQFPLLHVHQPPLSSREDRTTFPRR